MKQHKWHKEIKAWADGAEIEFQEIYEGGMRSNWKISEQPRWDDRVEYRIKPQPKEPKYLYAHLNKQKQIIEWSDQNEYINTVCYTYIGKIKLEGEDNE